MTMNVFMAKKYFKKHILLSYSVLILTINFMYFYHLRCEYGISGGKTNGQLQLEGTQILVGSEMLMMMTKITTHIMEIQHNRCKESISAEENFDFYMTQTINEVMNYPKKP